MRMVVCMKAVPSTTEVRMDPKTNTIVRDGRQSVVNPFDTAALEVALELKERLGGTVRALSMGAPSARRHRPWRGLGDAPLGPCVRRSGYACHLLCPLACVGGGWRVP